jgi:hypothetical protein
MTKGGGLLQLVAQGKQDLYLTGNPQVSWFKFVYRRYTNFALESLPMYFDGAGDFGKRITCVVPRRGDLLGQVFLEVELPAIYLATGSGGGCVCGPGGEIIPSGDVASYVNSIGHALIKEIKVEVGEQEIDKQTGEWMEIWTNFSTPSGQRQALNVMIGRAEGFPVSDGSFNTGPLSLKIPLQFWFCKNPGSYLPLIALQYHPVRITVEFRPLQQLFMKTNPVTACTQTVLPASITSCMLWGDYVYLSEEERRRYVSAAHEYLIEQVQYTPVIPIPAAASSVTVPMEFNHPLREFFWYIRSNRMDTYNEWFNYTNLAAIESGQRRVDMMSNAVLQLDGYDRFDARDGKYFRLVQPYQRHTVTPFDKFIYNYSFSLWPEQAQPSGSLNASRIDNLVFQLGLTAGVLPDPGQMTTRVYTRNHNVFRVVEGFGGLMFTV